MALLQGGQGPVAGVELRGQGHQLEHRRQAEAGNARIGQLYSQVAGDKQQANEDERHGQLGADVGNGDDGGPQLDGQVVGGILDGVARLVGGDADGGGGGVVVHGIGQADHIGAWVIVIGEIARHPFDTDLMQAVGVQHHAGGICSGEAAHGKLLGILAEGPVDPIAGPHGQYHSGQHQDQIIDIEKHDNHSFCVVIFLSVPKYYEQIHRCWAYFQEKSPRRLPRGYVFILPPKILRPAAPPPGAGTPARPDIVRCAGGCRR